MDAAVGTRHERSRAVTDHDDTREAASNLARDLRRRGVLPRDATMVLHAFGHTGQTYPAGGFVAALIEACMRADSINLMRIGREFPGIALAVEAGKNNPAGIAALVLVGGIG